TMGRAAALSLAEATDREISICVARLPRRSCRVLPGDFAFAEALRWTVFKTGGRRSILGAARKVVRSGAMHQLFHQRSRGSRSFIRDPHYFVLHTAPLKQESIGCRL